MQLTGVLQFSKHVENLTVCVVIMPLNCFSSSLLCTISHVSTDINLFVPTKIKMFDYKIDYRFCVINLLRLLNSTIVKGSVEKTLSCLYWILFFGLLKIQIIFKMKSNNKMYSLFTLFFIINILLLFFTQSKPKWFFLRPFLIQTDNSFHKILPLCFIYILLFLFF